MISTGSVRISPEQVTTGVMQTGSGAAGGADVAGGADAPGGDEEAVAEDGLPRAAPPAGAE